MKSRQTKELQKYRYVPTEVFADLKNIKPASARSRYCRYGHYFGVIPEKQENGRLRWPIDDDR